MIILQKEIDIYMSAFKYLFQQYCVRHKNLVVWVCYVVRDIEKLR